MSALEKMDRKKLSIASLIVAAVFFFFLNILSSLEIKTSQVDLTENQLFTLSEGSKKIISSINEPITFRFYYSQ
ncbi:MAG: Gldg family protein, partial [Rhodospirillales bacterium]|nr:Gldg family protein [Rhodospirillales bacterium]